MACSKSQNMKKNTNDDELTRFWGCGVVAPTAKCSEGVDRESPSVANRLSVPWSHSARKSGVTWWGVWGVISLPVCLIVLRFLLLFAPAASKLLFGVACCATVPQDGIFATATYKMAYLPQPHTRWHIATTTPHMGLRSVHGVTFGSCIRACGVGVRDDTLGSAKDGHIATLVCVMHQAFPPLPHIPSYKVVGGKVKIRCKPCFLRGN